MKCTILASMVGLAVSAHAAVLHDNGAVFNVAGSPNLSVLASADGTFGFGAQAGSGNSVADDFSVSGGGWNVNRLTFFMYQTGATAFTFTGLDYQIASSHSDPISWTSAASRVDGGVVAYRVLETATGTLNRPIFAIEVPVSQSLADGNYVLRWRAAGSLASGPWQPPVVPTSGVGNARQSTAGGAFNAVVHGASGAAVEMPFVISGTVVPAPGALALLGLGGIAIGRRRR